MNKLRLFIPVFIGLFICQFSQAQVDSVKTDSCTAVVTNMVWANNSSSANDTLRFATFNCEPFWVKLKVYNRWGESLIDASNVEIPVSEFKEAIKTSGTFFFVVSYHFDNHEEKRESSGSITVMY